MDEGLGLATEKRPFRNGPFCIKAQRVTRPVLKT